MMECIWEAFNEQRAGKRAKDLSDIVNDSMILAHVELTKTTYHRGMVTSIATYFKKPTFPTLVQHFLHYQLSSGSRFDVDTSNSETLSLLRIPTADATEHGLEEPPSWAETPDGSDAASGTLQSAREIFRKGLDS
ncbi:hypothetical protein EDB89DRAFT_2079066 [Lactarius sanguifluus]|nr:hypothetical protein EDB89DRAFT_2079066 [Lactarius sanguifluus]